MYFIQQTFSCSICFNKWYKQFHLCLITVWIFSVTLVAGPEIDDVEGYYVLSNVIILTMNIPRLTLAKNTFRLVLVQEIILFVR